MLVFSAPHLVAIIAAYSLLMGFPLAYWLLHKNRELGLLDKTVLGFIAGLGLPPILLFLLSFAMPVGPISIAAVSLVLLAAGMGMFLKDNCLASLKAELGESVAGLGALKLSLRNPGELANSPALGTIVSLAVFALILITFLTRFQTYSPIFSEIDPYYYIYSAQMLITDGSIPVHDATAWYPFTEMSSHRVRPLVPHLEAIWYFLYTNVMGVSGYNNYLLSIISCFYPPIAGMLITYTFYLLFRVLYNKRVGLIAAAISVMIPTIIQKTLAGTYELAPMGMFAIVFVFAAYVYAMKDVSDRKRLAVAAFAILILILGTNYGMLFAVPMTIYLGLQAMVSGLASFKNNKVDLGQFAIFNIVLAAIAVLAELLYNSYGSGMLQPEPPTIMLGYIGAAVFLGGIALLLKKVTDKEYKTYAFVAIALVGLALLLFSPLKDKIREVGMSTLGFAGYKVPLERTIAEQGMAGSNFEGSLGFIGKSLEGTQFQILEGLSSGLIFSAGSDTMVNLVLGMAVPIHTSEKHGLFIIFILISVLAALYLVARALLQQGEPILPELLLLIFVLGVTYVGVNKIKFTLLLSLTSVISFGIAYYYLERYLRHVLTVITGFLTRTAIIDISKPGEGFFESIQPVAVQVILFVLALFLVFSQYNSYPLAGPLLLHAFEPRFGDNPEMFMPKMQNICDRVRDPTACSAATPQYTENISEQFNSMACKYSVISDVFAPKEDELLAANFKCDFRLTDYWVDTMEWVDRHTEKNARFASWWDYGHWLNFLGQRNTVLRNEQSSLDMIGTIADAYTNASAEELKQRMLFYNATYAIFDGELILAGTNNLGAKYGALNYLGCAWNNRTNVSVPPGTSECERQHLWETIVIPATPRPEESCAISQVRNIKGAIAYSVSDSGNLQSIYCVGDAKLADGSSMAGTYYLGKTDGNGDLVLNKGFIGMASNQSGYIQAIMFYTPDKIWLEDGQLVDGMGDAKTHFYQTALYRAFFLNDLPGFKLVYQTNGGEVKIYQISDEPSQPPVSPSPTPTPTSQPPPANTSTTATNETNYSSNTTNTNK